ncbi:unnamed protein product [Hermetia illucens]|uniref:SCP domain-containing protein n=1 Tax=Hermetia illucens TaxID=343691 RepID=A0A7R8V1R3_HERIL|nr:antigen 5 like allergen Cul n 1-like [Hermetia illucens]CAD7091196.1 unnamed protein product [Hermetia illucens]
MKASIFFLIPILFVLQTQAQTRDYCAATLCETGYHVACIKKNVFAATCPKDAKLVTGGNYQVNILKAHNRVRNDIALATATGFESAMRMATVVWDNELATLAQVWVKQCVAENDECRNTDRFNSVGQNVHSTLKSNNFDIPTLINEILDEWYNEYSAMTAAEISAYTADDTYRNFAQLAVDKVTRIGCATVQYTEGSKFRVFTVCNYASSPQDGQPLYVTGCPLAQCLKGKNNDFPGLCHPSEIIDPNFFD